jgi:peptidoglycan/xylan/chitin deacetylase (PgdA/CDA1 family)
LFRLPFGDYNGKVLDTVTETGNYCVQWDIDSGDSEDLTKVEIFNNVVKKAGNGSIIIFHTNSSQTIEALDDIIGELKKQGYSFALVSNMIYKDNYYIDYAGRQRRVN